MKLMLTRLLALLVLAVCMVHSHDTRATEVLRVGINRPSLLRLPDQVWKREMENMARSGVRLLRTNLVPPFDKAPEVAKYAKALGIDIVLIIPTWLPTFYDTNARKRPGNGPLPAVFPLSEIDPKRVETFLEEHRQDMQSHNASVAAYQLGNEINSAAFNGDFPMGKDAIMLVGQCKQVGSCTQIRAGWRKYVTLLKIVKKSGVLRDSPLIGASMARLTRSWARTRGASYLDARNVILELRNLGADEFVDAYAFNLYFPRRIKESDFDNGIRQPLYAALEDCSAIRHATKPCWITEWGIPSIAESCWADQRRNSLMVKTVALMRRLAKSSKLSAIFVYDWDADRKLSIFRCGATVVDRVVFAP